MADRPLLKDLRYRCEAALAYGLFGLFRLLPVSWSSATGGTVTRWLGPLSGPHKTAIQNLSAAMPEMDDDTRATVLQDAWENLGRVMAEYATLSRLWGSQESGRIEVDGAHHLRQARDSGAPVILFSGHIGNWEVIPLVISRLFEPPAIVYRAPNNPYVEDLLQLCRDGSASRQIPKGQSGARDIMRVLKGKGIAAMLVDQKSNTGLPIPLFGRDAMTGDAVARMALRTNSKIIPVRAFRESGCRFKVVFEQPWHVEEGVDTNTDVHELLVRMNAKLESWIRETPGQWLWPHNRWPKDQVSS